MQVTCSALEQQRPTHGPGYLLSIESLLPQMRLFLALDLRVAAMIRIEEVGVTSSFLAAYVSELEMLALVIKYLRPRHLIQQRVQLEIPNQALFHINHFDFCCFLALAVVLVDACRHRTTDIVCKYSFVSNPPTPPKACHADGNRARKW